MVAKDGAALADCPVFLNDHPCRLTRQQVGVRLPPNLFAVSTSSEAVLSFRLPHRPGRVTMASSPPQEGLGGAPCLRKVEPTMEHLGKVPCNPLEEVWISLGDIQGR